MPWTRRQVKKLLSSGSPLTGEQKAKMQAELHADPSLGHAKKGSAEMKRAPRRKDTESHSYDWRKNRNRDRGGKYHRTQFP